MRVEKKIIKDEYAARLTGRRALVVVDYTGLSSEGFNRLRRVTAGEGAGCLVVKNLIFRRILPDLGWSELDPFFSGQTSVFYTDGELPGLLKVLLEFGKAEGSPRPKGAYWMGTFFSGFDLERLATLPSREELLAQVTSGVQGPLRGLVGVLSGVLSGLVGTITALKDQRSGS